VYAKTHQTCNTQRAVNGFIRDLAFDSLEGVIWHRMRGATCSGKFIEFADPEVIQSGE
jgi:hypothetical protein